MPTRRTAGALALVALLAACTPQPPSPETQIRARLEAAERAIEARDLDAVLEGVAPTYAGPRGQTKRDLELLLRYLFLRHQDIRLLTQLRSLELMPPNAAEVTLLVAMAGQGSPEQALTSLQADVYRFTLRLQTEDSETWRVVDADWRPATPSALLTWPPG